MSYKFFQNKECEFLTCHSIQENKKEQFNCLFCFCPLYSTVDCGGNYTFLPNNLKDCSNCTIPHFNYDYIIDKLKEFNNEKQN